jgi:hypothetical protein
MLKLLSRSRPSLSILRFQNTFTVVLRHVFPVSRNRKLNFKILGIGKTFPPSSFIIGSEFFATRRGLSFGIKCCVVRWKVNQNFGNVPPKRWWTYNALYDVISQKTEPFIITAVGTSNLCNILKVPTGMLPNLKLQTKLLLFAGIDLLISVLYFFHRLLLWLRILYIIYV